jgi:hypothetical protein
MKLLTFIVPLVVVAIAIALVALRRSPANPIPSGNVGSTEELIQRLADQAIDIAKEDGITGLDYSEKSIQKVEQILGQLHEEHRRTKAETGIQGLASAFGAYVGECIRRNNPCAKWERDHPTMGDKSYPLHWQGGEVFPMAWCYRRIINGSEDNVWHKFSVVKRSNALPTS